MFKNTKLHMWSADSYSAIIFWQKKNPLSEINNHKVKVLFFSCAFDGV